MESRKSLKTTQRTTVSPGNTRQPSNAATETNELSIQELFNRAAAVYKKDAKRSGGALRRFWDTAFEEGKKFALEEAREEAFQAGMKAAYEQRTLREEQREELKESRKESRDELGAEIEPDLMKGKVLQEQQPNGSSNKTLSVAETNGPIMEQKSSSVHLDPRASIDYLPPEILSKIFLLTDVRHSHYLGSQTQIYPIHRHSAYCHSNSTGSHLGCVCRYWRGVTLNTPALWSSILVDLEACSRKARKSFETHIERSANNFLSITFLFQTFSFGPCRRWMDRSSDLDIDEVPEAWRIMKCIIGQAKRIRELSLWFRPGTSDTFTTSFMPDVRDRFENLAHLVVNVDRNDPYAVLNTFTASPLRNIEIYNYNITYDSQEHRFPCSRLTNIVLEDTTLTLATEVLSKSLSLESARLRVRQNTPLHPNISPCFLTNLSNLDLEVTIGGLTKDTYVDFVKLLTFPALVSLSFAMCETTDLVFLFKHPAFAQAFIGFVKRSPRIHTFRLHRTDFDNQEVLMLLEEMPELAVFDFEVTSSFDGGVLVKELGEGRVAPKLKELKVKWFSGEIDWEVWKEMIHRRWLAEPPLRSVYLKVGARFSVPENVQGWVQDMQLKGRAVWFSPWY